MVLLEAEECLSLHIQTNMSSTAAHLQSLPDFKKKVCKCQDLKITMVVLNCCFILADIRTKKHSKDQYFLPIANF